METLPWHGYRPVPVCLVCGRPEPRRASGNPILESSWNTTIFENQGNNRNESVFATPLYHAGYAYAFGDFDQDGHNEFVTALDDDRPWPVLVYRCMGDSQYDLVDSIVPPCSNGYDIFGGFNLSGNNKPEFFVVYDRYDGVSCDFIPCMYGSDGPELQPDDN